MTTMRVIPPLEPRENLSASVVSCRETISVQHFRLKARKKRLHHRVIETVANATHGPHDAQFPAARGEGHSRVFFPWVQPVVATLPWFLHCNTVFTAVQSDAYAAEVRTRFGVQRGFKRQSG